MPRSRRKTSLPVVVGIAVMLASLARAGTIDWNKAQRVDVVTTEYVFTPSRFSFKAGGVYRLHIVNHGKELHEFAASKFFRAIDIRSTKTMNGDHTEIDVRPGRAVDFYFVAKTPGAYKLTCPDHDWAGMTGDITITP